MQQLLDTLVSLFILTFKLDGANGLYFDQRLKISIDQLLSFFLNQVGNCEMLSVFLRPCFTTAIFLSGYYYLHICYY